MRLISKSDKIVLIRYLFFSFVLLYSGSLSSQCEEVLPGTIWKSPLSRISVENLAFHAAPMLWFSPDEIELFDVTGKIQLPDAFPFEKESQAVVYYKIRNIYSHLKNPYVDETEKLQQGQRVLDLNEVTAIDLDFYYYFEKETGLGSHPHDIESITLQIQIDKELLCLESAYRIVVDKVTARAHGLHWYNSVLDVDEQTFFPLSIILEEGKHASATDKNADGVFTPGFDVTRRVNDAWGVRDVITTGRLFSGGYQGWMSKPRDTKTLLFPPFPSTSPFFQPFQEKFGEDLIQTNVYDLRPYPLYPVTGLDKKLNKLMKGKKPHNWPKIEKTSGNGKVKQWAKQERAFRSIGFSMRWDETTFYPSLSIPLGVLKSVEAPLTGGWLYHKIYLPLDTIVSQSGIEYERILGHQIMHSSSASRWIDTYVGLGYEWHGDILENGNVDRKLRFVSEAGLKVRLNISKTPLRFLKYLGGEFWGIRFGWKNVGFQNFLQSGFVLEIGAGSF